MKIAICPHCQREIKNKHALHIASCPLAPQHKMHYRAAMEDEEYPGVLGLRMDYDRRRQPGMSSGCSLNHTFRLPWNEIGKLFDLREKSYMDYEDIDAEVEVGKRADFGESTGLPVLDNGREVIHGGKIYVYYQIR